MSILDMFKTQAAPAPTAPVTQATPQQAMPGNIQDPTAVAAQSQVAEVNVPAAMVQANPADTANDPLAQFTGLWETVATDEGQPSQPVVLDQATVQKAVASTNFAEGITPELMQAITSGGEGAEKAFATALNQMAQQVMVQSTLVNNKLSERSLATAQERFEASIPDMLRKQGAANHLNETNPLFKNPAIAPVVQATQSQLLQKFPNATQAELTKMTNDYILAMGQAFAPAPTVDPTAPVDQDWDKIMTQG